MAAPWIIREIQFSSQSFDTGRHRHGALSGWHHLAGQRTYDDQLQNETRALLSTADTQFTNGLNTRADSLIRQFSQIPKQSGFFSVAKQFGSRDAADQQAAISTMNLMLADDLALSRDTAVMAFADADGQFRASAIRDPSLGTNQFYVACAPLVANVLSDRTAVVQTVQVGNSLFSAVVIPSFNITTGESLGALTFAIDMNAAMANEVKSAESQLVFLAGDKVVASTLEPDDLNALLTGDYRSVAGGGQKDGIRPTTLLTLQGKHFGARAGKFPHFAGPGNASYLLLVSYEKPAAGPRRRTAFLDAQRPARRHSQHLHRLDRWCGA